MTSSEATRLWRRAIKESFDCTCVYCGQPYELHELTIDHVHPRSAAVKLSQVTACQLALRAIRVKEVTIGKTGC